jgi:hypothetical protein
VIEWFVWAQVTLAGAAALSAVGFALLRKTPNDYTLGPVALMFVALLVQMVIALIAPSTGNTPTGSLLEWWMYAITALMMIPAATIWALVERSVMSNVLLGLLAATIAVMLTRMHTIWFINGA